MLCDDPEYRTDICTWGVEEIMVVLGDVDVLSKRPISSDLMFITPTQKPSSYQLLVWGTEAFALHLYNGGSLEELEGRWGLELPIDIYDYEHSNQFVLGEDNWIELTKLTECRVEAMQTDVANFTEFVHAYNASKWKLPRV